MLMRGEANWNIWKAKCSMEMEQVDVTKRGVQICIWKEIWLYSKLGWVELLKKVDLGKVTLQKPKANY